MFRSCKSILLLITVVFLLRPHSVFSQVPEVLQYKPNPKLNIICLIPKNSETPLEDVNVGKVKANQVKLLGTLSFELKKIKGKLNALKGKEDQSSISKRRKLKSKRKALNSCVSVAKEFRDSPEGPPPACAPQNISPSGNRSADNAGTSVAKSGSWAIIGVPFDDDLGASSGSASIYFFDGISWKETQKIIAIDGATDDRFGYSVAIKGDVAVVGAFNDDDKGTNSGAAYVYRRNGTVWSFDGKLVPQDGQAGDVFGWDVAIYNNTVVVGAYGDDDNGTYSGSAYVFVKNGGSWVQLQKLIPTDPAPSDFFGVSIGIYGNRIVVGAYLEDEAATNAGAVYVFKLNGATYEQEQKLLPISPEEESNFGSDVSISDSEIIVGVPDSNLAGPASGAAQAFQYNGSTWISKGILIASIAYGHEGFGNSVSVSGNLAIIGAPHAQDHSVMWPHIDQGAAFLFHYNSQSGTWEEIKAILAEDGWSYDLFGTSVSIDEVGYMIGAPGDANNGTDAGSVYAFGSQCRE